MTANPHRGPESRARAIPLEPSLAHTGFGLRELFRVFWKGTPLILLCAGLAVVLAILYVWITPPLYSATAELLIDPRQKGTFENEVSPTGLGRSAAGADTLLLDSQIAVMESQAVIGRLIREENLTEDPEFVSSDRASIAGVIKTALKGAIYGPRLQHWNSISGFDRANTTLRKQLRIERERNTYVIAITMLSESSEKAALLANKIADIYIEESNSAAADTTLEAAQSLRSRLDELSRNARVAARQVEDYRRANDLIGTQNVLVVEQQLRDLNEQLTQSQGREKEALATLNQVKAAGALGVAELGPIAGVPQSQVLSQLQTNYANVESTAAALSVSLMANHPRLIELSERKKALQGSISAEYQRIVARLQVEYEAALENTQALTAEVGRLQAQMALSNENSVELQELQREADASQAVYQSFLTRSKEASEQIGIPNSTARKISEAYPATRPSFPAVKLLLPAAAVLGLLIGVIIVWVRYLLKSGEPPRAPLPRQPIPDTHIPVRTYRRRQQ
ncbi:GumC family protein [Roseibium sp.]|uniref:GumC family protein n=1 Tax=Roseibium sp. TaxID=1936156 RepID=UPI003B52DD77